RAAHATDQVRTFCMIPPGAKVLNTTTAAPRRFRTVSIKQSAGEILEAGVDDDCGHDFSGSQLAGYLDRCSNIQRARGADEEPFFPGELMGEPSRLAFVDRACLVVGPIDHVWRHAAGADTLDAVRAATSFGQRR